MSYSFMNKVSVKWRDDIDSKVLGQIKHKAIENGIEYEYVLNEKAIISALKKQVPQNATGGFCPSCHRIFLFKFGETRKGNYCDNCGQLLNWGDGE